MQPVREFELTDLSPPDAKCSQTSNIFATAGCSHSPYHVCWGGGIVPWDVTDTQLSELRFFDDMRFVYIHIIYKIARSKTFFGKEVKERGGPELKVSIKNIAAWNLMLR